MAGKNLVTLISTSEYNQYLNKKATISIDNDAERLGIDVKEYFGVCEQNCNVVNSLDYLDNTMLITVLHDEMTKDIPIEVYNTYILAEVHGETKNYYINRIVQKLLPVYGSTYYKVMLIEFSSDNEANKFVADLDSKMTQVTFYQGNEKGEMKIATSMNKNTEYAFRFPEVLYSSILDTKATGADPKFEFNNVEIWNYYYKAYYIRAISGSPTSPFLKGTMKDYVLPKNDCILYNMVNTRLVAESKSWTKNFPLRLDTIENDLRTVEWNKVTVNNLMGMIKEKYPYYPTPDRSLSYKTNAPDTFKDELTTYISLDLTAGIICSSDMFDSLMTELAMTGTISKMTSKYKYRGLKELNDAMGASINDGQTFGIVNLLQYHISKFIDLSRGNTVHVEDRLNNLITNVNLVNYGKPILCLKIDPTTAVQKVIIASSIGMKEYSISDITADLYMTTADSKSQIGYVMTYDSYTKTLNIYHLPMTMNDMAVLVRKPFLYI